MNNKAIGTIFCVIAAMLMSVRYLVTAIFMSGVSSWSAELFSAGLEYVGAPLKIAAIAALLSWLILFIGIANHALKNPSLLTPYLSKRRYEIKTPEV